MEASNGDTNECNQESGELECNFIGIEIDIIFSPFFFTLFEVRDEIFSLLEGDLIDWFFLDREVSGCFLDIEREFIEMLELDETFFWVPGSFLNLISDPLLSFGVPDCFFGIDAIFKVREEGNRKVRGGRDLEFFGGIGDLILVLIFGE